MPMAEEILDELLPEEYDWRETVRRYPRASLGVAALAGFLLARRQGPELLSALSAFAAREATELVEELLGR